MSCITIFILFQLENMTNINVEVEQEYRISLSFNA
jgi:hypothetical protein